MLSLYARLLVFWSFAWQSKLEQCTPLTSDHYMYRQLCYPHYRQSHFYLIQEKKKHSAKPCHFAVSSFLSPDLTALSFLLLLFSLGIMIINQDQMKQKKNIEIIPSLIYTFRKSYDEILYSVCCMGHQVETQCHMISNFLG